MRDILLQCDTMCCSMFVVCRDMYMRDILLQYVAVCSNVLQYVCSVYIKYTETCI